METSSWQKIPKYGYLFANLSFSKRKPIRQGMCIALQHHSDNFFRVNKEHISDNVSSFFLFSAWRNLFHFLQLAFVLISEPRELKIFRRYRWYVNGVTDIVIFIEYFRREKDSIVESIQRAVKLSAILFRCAVFADGVENEKYRWLRKRLKDTFLEISFFFSLCLVFSQVCMGWRWNDFSTFYVSFFFYHEFCRRKTNCCFGCRM